MFLRFHCHDSRAENGRARRDFWYLQNDRRNRKRELDLMDSYENGVDFSRF